MQAIDRALVDLGDTPFDQFAARVELVLRQHNVANLEFFDAAELVGSVGVHPDDNLCAGFEACCPQKPQQARGCEHQVGPISISVAFIGKEAADHTVADAACQTQCPAN